MTTGLLWQASALTLGLRYPSHTQGVTPRAGPQADPRDRPSNLCLSFVLGEVR